MDCTTAAGRFVPRGVLPRPVATARTTTAETQEAGRSASHESGANSCDLCSFAEPSYLYRYDNSSYHVRYLDDAGYHWWRCGAESV